MAPQPMAYRVIGRFGGCEDFLASVSSSGAGSSAALRRMSDGVAFVRTVSFPGPRRQRL